MFRSSRLKQHRQRTPIVAAAVVALIVFGTVLAGCGGSSGENASSDSGGGSAPQEEGVQKTKLSSAEVPEVTLALTAQEVSLNLLTAPTVPTVSLVANVARGLLEYGPDGSLHSGVAKSWKEVSPTEYVYMLKPGLKFSTGAPVTADDVLYSLKYESNPKTGSVTSSFYLTVKSIEKVGSNEIKVTLKKPDPTWRYVPAHYPAWIYEKKSLEEGGENFGGPQGIPVGTGPYAINEMTNDHITFVRNKYYAGPKPPVAKFVVKLVADPGTSLAAMQSGDIDGALYVPLQSTNQWESIEGTSIFSTVSPNQDNLWINTSKAPFDDPHVRRALMYAFNREAVVKSIFHGQAIVFPTQVAPQMWGNEMSVSEAEARSHEQGREYPFDMEKAKAELAQTKYKDGFSATVIYPSSAPELGLALQALSQSLKELNVNLEVKELNDTPFYSKLYGSAGEFEVAASTGSYDYPDPLGFYYLTLCGCAIPPNGFNASHYKNPKLDKLFEEAYADTNHTSRVDKILEAVTLITEEQPLPMLWFRNVVTALKSNLAITNLGPWTFFDTPWMADIGETASQ
jgi:peptide/nickel transport system substrate-binding protein